MSLLLLEMARDAPFDFSYKKSSTFIFEFVNKSSHRIGYPNKPLHWVVNAFSLALFLSIVVPFNSLGSPQIEAIVQRSDIFRKISEKKDRLTNC